MYQSYIISSMTEDKELVPGIYTRNVASVPPDKIGWKTLEDLRKLPGVETSLEERPGEKPRVKIRVNTIVLPPVKGKKS